MIGTLLLIIVPGIFHIDLNNITPFFQEGMTLGLLFVTIFYISEMFFGWEDITFLAEETKDAEKVIPKAITRGTIFAVIFSLIFSFIVLTVIKPSVLGGSSAPMKAVASGIGFSPIMMLILTIMIFLALVGGMASQSVSSPRLLLALANA